jgi:hypothetical protein
MEGHASKKTQESPKKRNHKENISSQTPSIVARNVSNKERGGPRRGTTKRT